MTIERDYFVLLGGNDAMDCTRMNPGFLELKDGVWTGKLGDYELREIKFTPEHSISFETIYTSGESRDKITLIYNLLEGWYETEQWVVSPQGTHWQINRFMKLTILPLNKKFYGGPTMPSEPPTST